MKNIGFIFLRIYVCTILLVVGVILLWSERSDINMYRNQLLCLLGCHIFMCSCLFYIVSRNGFYIFEPIIFVILMYYMIFVFTPIYNIFMDNVDIYGTNTMGGCIKATTIFMIGFCMLLLGYYSEVKTDRKDRMLLALYKNEKLEYDVNSLLRYSYIIWTISVLIYLLYNVMTGRNLLYMLSFGFLSQGLNDAQGYSVDFLAMIIYCSFFPMMNILIYGKSKVIKIFVYFITCVPVATRGFRSVLIIPLIAPFVYRYMKNKKKPPIYSMVIVLLLVVFMLGFIANTRGSMRVGDGVNIDGYAYEDGINGALDYFSSYKAFYGAVMKYPSTYSYTFGRQLLYSIVMYIPRAIWPGKPTSLIQEVIGNSTNQIARLSGAAWPNIGEYYTDGGILETIILMFILGRIFNKMKKMYEIPKTQSSVIAYSLLLPGLIPIIAYGYTAGNLPTIIFMMLPFWCEKYFVKLKY